MLPQELLKKVRHIEIATRKIVDDLMGGRYRSHFKGQGVQFSEHRVYMPGDDVRHIDWKVSARSRDPLIKKFEEERELSVLLLVDVSASTSFGTSEKSKSEINAELAGLLAFAATHSGDKVGALLFAGEVEKVIPLKKGRNHVLRMIRDLLSYEAKTQGTRLDEALEQAARVMKHSGVIFVLSDFLTDEYEKGLRRLARKHDVVAIRVWDEREQEIPPIGLFRMLDPETGLESVIDPGSYAFKKWWKEQKQKQDSTRANLLKNLGVEELAISTAEDYGDRVVKFFKARARRGGRR